MGLLKVLISNWYFGLELYWLVVSIIIFIIFTPTKQLILIIPSVTQVFQAGSTTKQTAFIFFNYATCYLERVHGNMTQNGHVWPSMSVCQDIQRGGENMNHLLNRLLPLRIMPIVVGGMMIVFDII